MLLLNVWGKLPIINCGNINIIQVLLILHGKHKGSRSLAAGKYKIVNIKKENQVLKQAYLTYSVGCCRMGVRSSRALSCNISSSTFLVLLCLPHIIIKETPSLHFLINYIIYPSSMVCLIFLESEAFIVTASQTSDQYLPCHISCPHH